MNMKAVVITLIIAICIECVLSVKNPEEAVKSKHRRRRNISSKSPSRNPTEQVKISSKKPTLNSTNQTGEKPETVITGKNGVIKVDGKIVQANNETFKNERIVSLTIYQGQISVNRSKVFEVKPGQSHGDSFSKIYSDEVRSFRVEIYKDGRVLYTDDQGVSKSYTL